MMYKYNENLDKSIEYWPAPPTQDSALQCALVNNFDLTHKKKKAD